MSMHQLSSLRALLRAASCSLIYALLVLPLGCSDKRTDTDDDPATLAEAGSSPSDAGADAFVLYVDAWIVPDAAPTSGELEAQLQINGNGGPCGSCAVVVAQARGNPPYSYEWNDPALQGPGPHRICPEANRSLSVKITDTEVAAAELAVPAKTVEVSDELTCSASDGTQWAGCSAQTTDAGMQAEATVCRTLEVREPVLNTLLFEAPISVSSPLDRTQGGLEPGKVYEFIYDQLLLTFNLGKAVTVTLYGSNTPCGDEQLFGVWTLDGRAHQSFCFVPEQVWRYIRVDIDIGDTFFYFDFVPAVGTTCRGCSDPQGAQALRARQTHASPLLGP